MQLINCPKICAMILDYVGGKTAINIVIKIPAFHRTLELSHYTMNCLVPIEYECPHEKVPLRHFIFWGNDGTNHYYLDYIFKNGRTRFIHRCVNFANEDVNKYTEIDPCYIVHSMNTHDAWGNPWYGAYPKCFDKKKYIEQETDDMTENDCTLILYGKSNITIEGTTINNLLLNRCKNITIRSRVRNEIYLRDCTNIKTERLCIQKLTLDWGVKNCTFLNVAKLQLFGRYVKNCTFGNINKCKIYGSLIQNWKFKVIRKLVKCHDNCKKTYNHKNGIINNSYFEYS